MGKRKEPRDWAVLLVLAVGGMASVASSRPPTAEVQVLGATIHPAAPDGLNWDGVGSATNEQINQLEETLAQTNPYLEVAAILSDVFADPDPFGTASFIINGEYRQDLELELPTQDDTVQPEWPRVTWTGIPIEDDTELVLFLGDEDLSEHDEIGTVSIGGDDLAELAGEEEIQVKVDRQDSRRILFVELFVEMD